MTRGEVKKFLSRAVYIWREEKRLEMKIAELRSLRERVTPSYSMAPGGGSGDKLMELTAKIIELEQEQRDKIADYLRRYREAEKYIELLDENDFNLANVLRLRYLEGERWEQIAVDLHYSWKQVFRLHDYGIKKIMQLQKDDTK